MYMIHSRSYIFLPWSLQYLTTNILFRILHSRDYHYPVCRMDIRPDSKFSTGYGYPKRVFLREQDPDKDIRFNMPYSIFWERRLDRLWNEFWSPSTSWRKLHIAHWFFCLWMHLVSFACHPYLRVYGVTSVQDCGPYRVDTSLSGRVCLVLLVLQRLF